MHVNENVHIIFLHDLTHIDVFKHHEYVRFYT